VQCNPDFAFYIAVGAGRSSAVLKRPSTLRCPPIEFISGVKDLKFQEAKSYVDALVSQGFSAHFSSHQGGHKIEEHSLRKALNKFF
jgi:predicted esterase